MRQDFHRLGTEALTTVLALLEDREVAPDSRLASSLVVRASTAPASR
ncbi:hypothetical protein SAMN04488544_0623 [Microlunatus sagamiharensis]|uniref:Substrate-binding protein-like domain-containing protein n=1 Tax=Microlunatus sagamiharensis TaxID=546874 RepID=A0A1H2LPY6_9ACTN|nr:hypothetical protein [Microlunatus sagamiharensis]SDU83060.1 hypothetical protein SAMN04488544_0623 [Microlunatus sagamiharensis]